MKHLRIAATVFGLLTALPASALAQPSAGTSPRDTTASHSSTEAGTQASTANTNATVHATKGVVKFVDANTLIATARAAAVSALDVLITTS